MHERDVYSVGEPIKQMFETTHMVPRMSCGGCTDGMISVTSWISVVGVAQSVLHKDGTDNMNCLFSGGKRMIFSTPSMSR